jgi:hypothetical protein
MAVEVVHHAEEIQRLPRRVSDLVGALTFPACWSFHNRRITTHAYRRPGSPGAHHSHGMHTHLTQGVGP